MEFDDSSWGGEEDAPGYVAPASEVAPPDVQAELEVIHRQGEALVWELKLAQARHKSRVNLAKQKAADAKLLTAEKSVAAVNALVELMESAESEAVRMGAARDLLDRAGVRGGSEIDVTVRNERTADPAGVLRERLARLASEAEAAAATRERVQQREIVEYTVVEPFTPSVNQSAADGASSTSNGGADSGSTEAA